MPVDDKTVLPDLSGKTILIAEDEENNYKLLVVYLTKTNAKIAWARNGKEAVNYILSNNADLILMDIKMPIMDGVDATKIIKRLKPEIPIIAQTAFAYENEISEFLKAGINDYLVKPLKVKEIAVILNTFFPKKS